MKYKPFNPTIIIKKYGYEYHLVQVDRINSGFPNPCFMEREGMALQSCKKIVDIKSDKKKKK